jgi:hypothetical protein
LDTPTVVVDAGLAVGDHRFRLVVVNTRGVESQPVEVTVSVVRAPPGPIPFPLPIPIPGPLPTPRRRPR